MALETIPEKIGTSLVIIIGLGFAFYFALATGIIPGILTPIWNYTTNVTAPPKIAGRSMAFLIIFVLLIAIVVSIYYSVKGG